MKILIQSAPQDLNWYIGAKMEIISNLDPLML